MFLSSEPKKTNRFALELKFKVKWKCEYVCTLVSKCRKQEPSEGTVDIKEKNDRERVTEGGCCHKCSKHAYYCF